MGSADLFERALDDDGLFTPSVGEWALSKYRPHAYYARLFTDAMAGKWDQLCYLGLCCGAGRARIRGTGEIVESSAMAVQRLPNPFTKYVFCDEDSRAIEALRQRSSSLARPLKVSFVVGDVNEVTRQIEDQIPRFGRDNTLLSFSFLDPFATDVKFETIRLLAANRNIDFLTLLPLGVDARRNFEQYLRPDDSRLDDFLGDRTWREKWRAAEKSPGNPIYFLARQFSEQMQTLGYLPTHTSEMKQVRSTQKRLNLYLLAFYSKHQLGKEFGREALARTAEQTELEI